MAFRESLLIIEFCSAPLLGRFHVECDRSEFGVVGLFLLRENKVMTQSELNHAIARQTGEPSTEIARHGFTSLAELPQDDDDEPLPVKVVARKVDD